MLVHHFKTFSKILLFIVSLSVGPVFAESESALGSAQKLYKEQRFSEARLVLQSEVKSNPRNASAHYLLGNCLLALKSFAQARDEYRSAAILDPKGQAGEFSRTALALLSQREAGEQKSAQAYASSRPQLQSSAGAGEYLDCSGFGYSTVRANDFPKCSIL